MKKYFIMAAAAMMVAINLSAQTKRSDDFRAKYQLKEVVVMSRHNIRSPLTSGGAVYKPVVTAWWCTGDGDGPVLPQVVGRRGTAT